MGILKFFLGDKGDDGTNGENGLGVADVDSYNLSEPMLDALNTNNLANSALITYNRTGRSSYIDMYGNNRWANQTTTTNYCQWSNAIDNWTDTSSRWTYIGTTTDPFGGSLASEINLDVDTSALSGTGDVAELIISGVPSPQILNMSFYIKVISGTVTGLDFVIGSTKYTLPAPTSSWVKVSYPVWCATSFIVSINPRGLTGARVGLYGVQLENNNYSSDLITTSGASAARTNDYLINKQGLKGLLIEEAKTNLIPDNNNLADWTLTNCTFANYSGADPFGDLNQNIRVVWGSLEDITLEKATDSLTPGNTYKVSVYAYITGGSLQSIKFSLGGGAEVTLPQVSVLGFTRIDVDCIAGNEDDLTVTCKSTNLTAQLHLSYFQIEPGDLTSPILNGSVTLARDQDLLSLPYAYNAPLPSSNWSFMFSKHLMDNNSSTKTIFSNGQSGANEFSLSFTNRLLTINNGGNTSSVDAYDYEKVLLVYNSTNIKIYGEKTLLLDEALLSTSHIATTLYLGSDGSANFFNAYLSRCAFYNVALTDNEVIYLMGA